MGRGWSWQTRVKQMERRRIRSMTYRQIDNVVRPPSADGTRRCADCANFPSCTRDRRGNHAVCFVRGNQKTVSPAPAETVPQSSGPTAWDWTRWTLIAVAFLTVSALLIFGLGKGGLVIWLTIMIIFFTVASIRR